MSALALAIANQLFLGLSTAEIFVLVSLGLTMLFGMMNVLNFTHGVLYALGAYFGYLAVKLTGSALTGIVVGGL